jgi:hypothetical protein
MTIAKALSVVTLVGSTLGLAACGGSSTPPPAAGGATPAGTTASADPSKTDSDDDGVFDDVDLCPGKKEDGKGDKPKDGCPG